MNRLFLSRGMSRSVNSIVARAIVYSEHGQPRDVLKAHSYKLDLTSLKPTEVVIQALAAPLNPSDINQIQGIYPSKPPISNDSLPDLPNGEEVAVTGNEGVFKVIAKGDKVKDLDVDDWCIPNGVNFGTWCTHRLTTESQLLKMAKTISIQQAATIAVNPSSAFQMLTYYEKLKPGEWFIQNGGNSQVGRAAIQIGRKLGLNSISVVRDRDDIDELKKELQSLGATHVITESENDSKDFGRNIKAWLDGKEIKLGLNCIGGSSATGVARKLGKDATLLTYGAMSMKPVSLPTSLFIFKNLTAKGFWITANIKTMPNSRQETLEEVLKLMESGDLVDTKYDETSVDPTTVTDDELLKVFQNALDKHGKQLIVFK